MVVSRNVIERYIKEWTENNIGEDFKFRVHQLEAIIDIVDNIVNKYKQNIVIEAPTGSGKSLINIISAGVLNEYFDLTSYILVSDLFLWEQYDKFIIKHPKMKFASIKGQTGNYNCKLNNEDIRNADCRMCGLSWAAMMNPDTQKRFGYDCARNCEYIKVRQKAIRSNVCLMTYQLFLFTMNNPSFNVDSHGQPIFSSRHILFCDECHNIPGIVQNQYSPTIKLSDFDKLSELWDYAQGNDPDLFNTTSDFQLLHDYTSKSAMTNDLMSCWNVFINDNTLKKDDVAAMHKFEDILQKFLDVVNDAEQYVSNKRKTNLPLTKNDIQLYKTCSWFRNQGCFWSDFNRAISEAGEEYLLKEITESNTEKIITISFKCTKEDYIVYRYLLSQAEYKVMLSATVGGKAAYDENMGFKYTEEKESTYSEIPSTFDFEKSPIHFLNKFKMSFREKENSFLHLKNVIYSICKTKFPDQKGIIQTGSYAFAKQLYQEAPLDIKQRMLLYNGSKEKTTCIKIHEFSENTILVGPTLNEGIDLPGDLCRFIIIMKVPYPSLANKLVKEKIKLFPLWYNSTTSNEIIQGIGRGVRFDGDWCVSYILDACWWKLYLETEEQYPNEFKKRLNII